MIRKTRSYLSPTPHRQSFARRWERPGREVRHGLVEKRAAEGRHELLIENLVECVEVDDGAAPIIDAATHRHVDAV